MSVGQLLNGLRQLLREALESREAERAVLHRTFIVALPACGIKSGRRRPVPDDVARALTHPDNLAMRALARRHHAHLTFEDGEAAGTIELPPLMPIQRSASQPSAVGR